jgi:hypothetical protein
MVFIDFIDCVHIPHPTLCSSALLCYHVNGRNWILVMGTQGSIKLWYCLVLIEIGYTELCNSSSVIKLTDSQTYLLIIRRPHPTRLVRVLRLTC